MDREPFFSFCLDDPKTDWAKVAKFLSKFSREAFNAETLVTDAENARYREAMVERLAVALKAPTDDDDFMKWLTKVYRGIRTAAVMARLGEIAREAIEPALLRVISDDFVARLRERIQQSREPGDRQSPEAEPSADGPGKAAGGTVVDSGEVVEDRQRVAPETTAEEMEIFEVVRDICVKAGVKADEILWKDTVNYFNVAIRKPTKWFLRFFGSARRKYIVTWVRTEEARKLVTGFEVEDSPAVWGVSRLYLDVPAQLWAVKALVLRSLELAQAGREDPTDVGPDHT